MARARTDTKEMYVHGTGDIVEVEPCIVTT